MLLFVWRDHVQGAELQRHGQQGKATVTQAAFDATPKFRMFMPEQMVILLANPVTECNTLVSAFSSELHCSFSPALGSHAQHYTPSVRLIPSCSALWFILSTSLRLKARVCCQLPNCFSVLFFQASCSLLFLSCIGLSIPTAGQAIYGDEKLPEEALKHISHGIAILLALVYVPPPVSLVHSAVLCCQCFLV